MEMEEKKTQARKIGLDFSRTIGQAPQRIVGMVPSARGPTKANKWQ